jgi:hypothetical protein
MAIDRDHPRACARTLALMGIVGQLLWSSCQAAESKPGEMGGKQITAAPAPSTSATPSTSGTNVADTNRPAANSPSTTDGTAGAPARSAAGTASTAQAGSAGASPTQGSSGTASVPQAGSGPAAGAAGTPAAASGSLPTVTDFKAMGPFTPKREPGPSGYVLFYPQELGRDGAKHPILSWGPGAVETASDFVTMLNHIASHGFAVISFDATPQGQELVTGIDFLLAENMRADSVFYEKLDSTKISAGGHSAGSLATFVIGGDQRLVTTLHISGGTFAPHTDIMNLHAPALFVCGEPGGDGLIVGDVAHPNCEIDFMNATVPVFYGITKGASHMTPTEIGDPALRTHQLGAMVGWLRWQLLGDANAGNMFVGDACTLCSDPAWSTAKPKNLK